MECSCSVHAWGARSIINSTKSAAQQGTGALDTALDNAIACLLLFLHPYLSTCLVNVETMDVRPWLLYDGCTVIRQCPVLV